MTLHEICYPKKRPMKRHKAAEAIIGEVLEGPVPYKEPSGYVGQAIRTSFGIVIFLPGAWHLGHLKYTVLPRRKRNGANA